MVPSQLASRVSLVYVTIGLLWILFSDHLTALLFAGSAYEVVQLLKGGSFVLVTGVVFFFFTRSRAQKLINVRQEASEYRRYSDVLFESSPVSFAVATLEGAYADANRAFLELMGWDRTDVGRFTIRSVTPPEYLEIEDERLDALISSGSYGPFEKEYIRKDGSRVPVRVFSRRIRLSGDELILICAEDTSDQKRYEQALISARDAAEEASHLKSSFLRNVTHELRTPLTGIIGYASLLQEELQGELSSFAVEIDQSGQRLLKTVTNVLDFARLEADDFPLTGREFDAVGELEDLLTEYSSQAAAKGLDFRVVREVGQFAMTSDPYAVCKIAEALLDNAVKFTKSGGVIVRLTELEGGFGIVVRDTGAGISESFRQNLFRAFKQESIGLARAYQGNGLGLALVQELTLRLGGRVGVESQTGAGSTFIVVLPRQSDFRLNGSARKSANSEGIDEKE